MICRCRRLRPALQQNLLLLLLVGVVGVVVVLICGSVLVMWCSLLGKMPPRVPVHRTTAAAAAATAAVAAVAAGSGGGCGGVSYLGQAHQQRTDVNVVHLLGVMST
jgi:hypothetical protein